MRGERGETPLHKASGLGYTEVIEAFVSFYDEDYDAFVVHDDDDDSDDYYGDDGNDNDNYGADDDDGDDDALERRRERRKEEEEDEMTIRDFMKLSIQLQPALGAMPPPPSASANASLRSVTTTTTTKNNNNNKKKKEWSPQQWQRAVSAAVRCTEQLQQEQLQQEHKQFTPDDLQQQSPSTKRINASRKALQMKLEVLNALNAEYETPLDVALKALASATPPPRRRRDGHVDDDTEYETTTTIIRLKETIELLKRHGGSEAVQIH